jgi:uncharacterized protein
MTGVASDAGIATGPQATPDTAPASPIPLGAGGDRITSLDFIRGIAVIGIVFANIVAFGQPISAYMYPSAFLGGTGDESGWFWVAQFVLIDGKMRGLFTLLFGAGLYLFLERAWLKGATRSLQVRRLAWLAAFGLAHYFLLWRGDILFLYACSGLVALLFVRMTVRRLTLVGLALYLFGALLYAGMTVPLQFVADAPVAAEGASELQADLLEGQEATSLEEQTDTALIRAGDYVGFVVHNVTDHAADLGFFLFIFWFETLPLMLLGMALYRSNLFSPGTNGPLPPRTSAALLVTGAVLSLAIALWIRAEGFTYYGTLAAFVGWSHIPRLFMTLGLVGLLARYAGKLGANGPSGRVQAAGRMAFTNYLGTSIVMLFVFHGFGLGLYAELNRPQLYLVAIGMGALMLAWSKPWLEQYRYGPLEWLWRCLTYGRLFPIRRANRA